MLEVTYTSKEEKYSFVTSFIRKLERLCQRTYELIPPEDVSIHTVFQIFHRNVSAIAKDVTKMLELWEHTYDSWLKIEPDEPDVTDETLIHTKYLLDIREEVHFLDLITIDLAQYDYPWIIEFKFRHLKLQWQKDENPHHFEERSVEVDSVNPSDEYSSDVHEIVHGFYPDTHASRVRVALLAKLQCLM